MKREKAEKEARKSGKGRVYVDVTPPETFIGPSGEGYSIAEDLKPPPSFIEEAKGKPITIAPSTAVSMGLITEEEGKKYGLGKVVVSPAAFKTGKEYQYAELLEKTAKDIYEKATPTEKLKLHVGTFFSGLGIKYTAAVIMPKGKTGKYYVEKYLTTTLRKGKGKPTPEFFVSESEKERVYGSLLGSIPGVLGTTAATGYGIGAGIKIVGAAPAIGSAAEPVWAGIKGKAGLIGLGITSAYGVTEMKKYEKLVEANISKEEIGAEVIKDVTTLLGFSYGIRGGLKYKPYKTVKPEKILKRIPTTVKTKVRPTESYFFEEGYKGVKYAPMTYEQAYLEGITVYQYGMAPTKIPSSFVSVRDIGTKGMKIPIKYLERPLSITNEAAMKQFDIYGTPSTVYGQRITPKIKYRYEATPKAYNPEELIYVKSKAGTLYGVYKGKKFIVTRTNIKVSPTGEVAVYGKDAVFFSKSGTPLNIKMTYEPELFGFKPPGKLSKPFDFSTFKEHPTFKPAPKKTVAPISKIKERVALDIIKPVKEVTPYTFEVTKPTKSSFIITGAVEKDVYKRELPSVFQKWTEKEKTTSRYDKLVKSGTISASILKSLKIKKPMVTALESVTSPKTTPLSSMKPVVKTKVEVASVTVPKTKVEVAPVTVPKPVGVRTYTPTTFMIPAMKKGKIGITKVAKPKPIGRGFQVLFRRKTGKVEPTKYGIFMKLGEAKRFAAIASLKTKSIKAFAVKPTRKLGRVRLFKKLPKFGKLKSSFKKRGEYYVETYKKSHKKKGKKKAKRKMGFRLKKMGLKRMKIPRVI
ncbi:MAG: hypothetical protein U9Q97_01120 [Acidobacteriota bacterium]|nr:hypothetical protein [Acidobacteriota bacterium]